MEKQLGEMTIEKLEKELETLRADCRDVFALGAEGYDDYVRLSRALDKVCDELAKRASL